MFRPALCAAWLAAAAALPALAQQPATFATPKDAIKFRQSTMKEMQRNFKRVADMANGRADFDAQVADASAARVAELIQQPWAAYGPGTEGGKALPAIWSEQDKFKAASVRAQDEVAKLAVAAKSGDLAAIKAAIGGAGAACKSCHDSFKD